MHWKTPLTESKGREKMFANHTSGKRVIQRLCRELLKFNSKNNQLKKWAKNLNRHFCKEEIQVANKHMKWFTRSQIMEMKIKTTVGYHPTTIRMTTVKKWENNKCLVRMWRHWNPWALLIDYKMIQMLWKTVCHFLMKNLKQNIMIQQFHFW